MKLCEGPVLVRECRKGYNMDKEAQNHELTETSPLESGRETSDHRRGSRDRQHSKRSMPAKRDRHGAVLCVAETCPSRSVSGTGKREERKESKQEEALKSEMERLRAVIAELSMENLELKKGRLV